jgi:hypothetical protein
MSFLLIVTRTRRIDTAPYPVLPVASVRRRTVARGSKPVTCVRQRTESKPLAGHCGILKRSLEQAAIAGKPAHPAKHPHHL